MVYTFTDMQGGTILTRAMDGTAVHDTYSVYDASGNLCHVLQPMFQEDGDLSKYAFRYEYDERNRLAKKMLPGTEPVLYEYDLKDRMTFSQDGNQRTAGKWTYYLYDGLNRLTEQGECTGKDLSTKTVLLQNYYDDYAFRGSAGFDNADFPAGTVDATGYLTGTAQRVLDTDKMLHAAYYYDIKGRIVKTVQENTLGGHDVTETVYTFTGNPQTVTHTHSASGKPTVTEVYAYTYDHADRVTKVEHTLDGTKVTLAGYEYDELGRMKARTLHGNAANRQAYAYNIRGWLTNISGNRFMQNLYYETGSGTPAYNGNISSMTWRAGSEGTMRGYKFAYDGLDRLENATYGEGTGLSSNTGRFSENVTSYDLNGNITDLQRYGQTGSSYGLVDNLTFTLNGNRLDRVDDSATGGLFGDAVKQANEYAYDENGNMAKDLNKNISEIEYNCLNLPGKVTFTDGSTIAYTYAADGTKLETVHTIGGATTTTDYCGNAVYENGTLKYLLTEEGYITPADGKYHYYLKDHQGNNRVVVDQAGKVEEVNHYYPFGGMFANSDVQPYKYNGKEYDKDSKWYDYGARNYDAALGRFTTMDPMAEKYYSASPYAYCGGNPVVRVDKEGKIWETIWDIGNVVYDIGAAVVDHVQGDHASAQRHWEDLALDAAATLLPGVPAGTSKFLKIADESADVVKVVKQTDKATDATETIIDATKATEDGARFIGDVDGKLIDTHKTPKGSYSQPDGSRTDILQDRPHYKKVGGGKTENHGTSHTHEVYENVSPSGEKYTGVSRNDTHTPTYEEVINIEDENAKKIR